MDVALLHEGQAIIGGAGGFFGFGEKLLHGDAEIIGNLHKGSFARYGLVSPARKGGGRNADFATNRRRGLAIKVAKFYKIIFKHFYTSILCKSNKPKYFKLFAFHKPKFF
jgi:hypothetical protein